MHSKLLLLITIVVSCSPNKTETTTNRLNGNWSPIIVLKDGEKYCEQKITKKPYSIEIKNNEKVELKVCNTTEFEYTVYNESISIKDTGKMRTTLLCMGLPGAIEDIWHHKWDYILSENLDTLTLFKFDEDELIKLIRSEKFNSSTYLKFYYSNNCKWPFTENEISGDSLNNEPIFNFAEVLPKLCTEKDPKKIIEDNLFQTNLMKRFDLYDRVFLRVIIDKCGSINGMHKYSEIDKIHEDAIYHVLNLMSCWQPATIDDKPVNMYYPLTFDFRKLK